MPKSIFGVIILLSFFGQDVFQNQSVSLPHFCFKKRLLVFLTKNQLATPILLQTRKQGDFLGRCAHTYTFPLCTLAPEFKSLALTMPKYIFFGVTIFLSFWTRHVFQINLFLYPISVLKRGCWYVSQKINWRLHFKLQSL